MTSPMPAPAPVSTVLGFRVNREIADLLAFVTRAKGVDTSQFARQALLGAIRAELSTMVARHETPAVDTAAAQFGPRALSCHD